MSPAGQPDRVIEAVFGAIDEVNQGRAPSQRIDRSLDTILVGAGSQVDSLGMVNLIVAIEEHVADACGATITIADERARTEAGDAFRTVGSLVRYITSLIQEQGHG